MIGTGRGRFAVGFGCGLRWCFRLRQAAEVTVQAEPHLLEEDLVALQLAVGFRDCELFVDFDFRESLRGELGFHLRGDAANASEMAFGVREFGSEKFDWV